MSRQVIVDYIPFEVTPQQINEAMSKNNGRLIVKGVLQRAEAKNQNGRIYPKETLMREAEKYSGVQIKERRALGELDHPDSSVVNLNNVSHNVLEMHWDGDDLVGTVEVLSSRGLGSVKEIREDDGSDTVEVQPDFELIAFDFVSNPSTHGAFLSPAGKTNEGVIKEGVGTRDGKCCHDCLIEDIINDIFRGE